MKQCGERKNFMYYIGIDLGTSACKMLLVDQSGQVKNAVTKEIGRAHV